MTLIPLGVFVGWVALTADNNRMRGGDIAAGAVVAIGGFAAPYIEMVGVLQAQTVGFLLLGGVWIGSSAWADTGSHRSFVQKLRDEHRSLPCSDAIAE